MYRAIILSTLLYISKSWVTYRHHLRLLEHFHLCCLCIILSICWSDFMANVEVLKQVVITRVEAMLVKLQLCWAGHIFRVVDHRLSETLALYDKLSTCHHGRWAPKKQYKDSLRKLHGAYHIDHHQLPTLTADCGAWYRGAWYCGAWYCGAWYRDAWYRTVHQAVTSFEDSSREILMEKCCRW